MALNLDEVRKIAVLARLRLSPAEEVTFAEQLGRVVDYIDQLERYEQAAPGPPETGERDAEDEVRPGLRRELFLANAPAALDGFLLVPDVIATGQLDADAAGGGALRGTGAEGGFAGEKGS